jgi:hypothetical protein
MHSLEEKLSRVTLLALALMVLFSSLYAAQSIAAGPPIISQTQVSHITGTSARFEATINPNEREVKQYFFEYVDQAAFEANGFKGASKTPTATLPSGKSDVPVSAQVSGLASGVAYHFRLFAQNSAGKSEGPALSFITYVTPPPFGQCSNDNFRGSSPSGALPDCRAYEQASPTNKNGGDLVGDVKRTRASVKGDRVSFQAYAPIPGGESAKEFNPAYLASRGSGGWSTQGLQGPQQSGEDEITVAWAPDFSHTYSWARIFGNPDTYTLLDHSSADGSITPIVPHTIGFPRPVVSGSSVDNSIVFFEDGDIPGALPLTPDAAKERNNLYVWDRNTGAYRLAGIFNDGKAPAGGSSAGAERGATNGTYTFDQHAISTDGSSVYFTAGGTGQLYLRKNPVKPQSPLNGEGKCADPNLACTYPVSVSQRTSKGPDPAGTKPVSFLGATTDGSKAFFTSTEMLTDDANTGPEQPPAQIGRAKIGESKGEEEKEDLISIHAVGVATSPDGNYIYWADPSTGMIGRAKLNGDGNPNPIEPLYINPGKTSYETHPNTEPGEIHSAPSAPRYVAVDDKYVYWTNTGPLGEQSDGGFIGAEEPIDGAGTIGRATIGPTEAEDIRPEFITGASNPQGIAVNSEHIYWANAGLNFANRSIGRATVAGSGVEQLFQNLAGTRLPSGIALTTDHLYLTEFGEGEHFGYIARTSSEGGPREALVFIGSDKPRGLTIDGGHVYWSVGDVKPEPSDDVTPLQPAIGRADLDLTLKSREREFLTPEGEPLGVAGDSEHLYWSVNGEAPSNPGNDLYRYDAATGKLIDLAPEHSHEVEGEMQGLNGAEVKGILGSSDDGSYLYYVAAGVLAEGASLGECRGSGEDVHGACNLYLDHEGQISFVTRLNADAHDEDNWSAQDERPPPLGGASKTSRVSPDGRTLLFTSAEKLTSYENEETPELYRYRVGEPIRCVSCNPTGLPPRGAPRFASLGPSGSLFPVAYLTRNLSTDGNRVFFETSDALLSTDTDGAEGCHLNSCQDVYEWEAKGTGSCGWQAQNGGCLYLISTGKGTGPAYLADASGSGDDVFFFTREQLVAQDKDSLLDVYDARVGGGFVSQSPPPPPVPCEGESCKEGAAAPPELGQPGTPLFSGPGNQKPRHKKVKKKKRHHKQKRHAKKPGRAQR